MTSNLNFEGILEVKKKKNAKLQKKAKSFFALFGKDTGHKGLKFYTVTYVTSIYTFVFISFSVSCIDPIILK